MVKRLRRPIGENLESLLITIAALAIIYPIAYWASPTIGIAVGHAVNWAIAGLGFNLLFGYTGLLSFGHALFLGVGAYAAGFMYKYLGIINVELHLLGSILASAIIAFLIGPIVVRYMRIFFAILMLAIGQVFWSLYYKFYWITGGTDGIKVPRPLLFGIPLEELDFATYHHIYYYFVLTLLAVLSFIMWRIVNSPFGQVIKAVRDNEERAKFIGINVIRVRLYAFIISAIYTGITGCLSVMHHRIVTPDIAYWTTSGKLVFLTILGGSKSFVGPILGAYIYHLIETYAMKYIYWQLIMGILIMVIVILMPKGVVQMIEWVSRISGSSSRIRTVKED